MLSCDRRLSSAGGLFSQDFVLHRAATADARSSSGCRLLAARLIKGRLCGGSGPFGSEEEPQAASVAAVVGSSKVGQTERIHLYLMFPVGPMLWTMNNSSSAALGYVLLRT